MVYFLLFFLFAGEHHHKAHEHGMGKMNVILEDDKVYVELDLSADAIVGFETEAKTSKQKKALGKADAVLSVSKNVLSLDGGSCKLEKENVRHIVDGGHADFELKYEYKCEKRNELKSLRVNLFSHFSHLKTIDASILMAKKAKKKKLTAKDAKIIFP